MEQSDQKLDAKTRIKKMESWLEERNSLQYLYRSPDFTSKFIKFAIPILRELPYTPYKDILRSDDRSLILKIIFRLKNASAQDSEDLLPVIVDIIKRDCYFNRSLVIKCLTGVLRKIKPTDPNIEGLLIAMVEFMRELLLDHHKDPMAEGYLYLFSETMHMFLYTGKNYMIYNSIVSSTNITNILSDFVTFYITNQDKANYVLKTTNTSVEFIYAIIKIIKFISENIQFLKLTKIIPDGILFLLNIMPPENFELKQDFYNLIFNLCTVHKEIFRHHIDIILGRGLLFKSPNKIVKAQGLSLFMDILIYDIDWIGVDKIFYSFQVLTEILEKELLMHKIQIFKSEEDDGILRSHGKGRIIISKEDMTVIELVVKSLSQLIDIMNQKPCHPPERQSFLLNCFYHYFQVFVFLAEVLLNGKDEETLMTTKEKVERENIKTESIKYLHETLRGVNSIFMQLEHINRAHVINLGCLNVFTDKDIEVFKNFFRYFISLARNDFLMNIEEFGVFFSRIETSIFKEMVEFNLKWLVESTKKNEKLFYLWNALSINTTNITIFTALLFEYSNSEIAFCSKDEVAFYKMFYAHIFKSFMAFPDSNEKLIIEYIKRFLHLFLTDDPDKIFYYEIILSLFNVLSMNYHKFASMYKVIFDSLPDIMKNLNELMRTYPENDLFIEILLCIPISMGFLHQHVKQMILPIKRGLKSKPYLQGLALRLLDQLFDLLRPEFLEVVVDKDLYFILQDVFLLLNQPQTRLAAARVLTRIKQYNRKYLEFNGLVYNSLQLDTSFEIKSEDYILPGNKILESAIFSLIDGKFEESFGDTGDKLFINKYKHVVFNILGDRSAYEESFGIINSFLDSMVNPNSEINIYNSNIEKKQMVYDALIALFRGVNNKNIHDELSTKIFGYILHLFSRISLKLARGEKSLEIFNDAMVEYLSINDERGSILYKEVFKVLQENNLYPNLFFKNILEMCLSFSYYGFNFNKRVCVRGARIIMKLGLEQEFYIQNKESIINGLFFYLENTPFPDKILTRDSIFSLLRKTHSSIADDRDEIFVEGLSSPNDNLRELCQSILDFISHLRGLHIVDLLEEHQEILVKNTAASQLGYISLESVIGMVECMSYILGFKPYVISVDDNINKYVQYISQLIKRDQVDLMDVLSPQQKKFAIISYKFLLLASKVVDDIPLIENLIGTFYKGLLSGVDEIINYSKSGLSIYVNNEMTKRIIVTHVQPLYSKFLYDAPSTQIITQVAHVFSVVSERFEQEVFKKAIELLSVEKFFDLALKILAEKTLTDFHLDQIIECIFNSGRRPLIENDIKTDIISLAEKNNPTFLFLLIKRLSNPLTIRFIKILLTSQQIKRYIQENKEEIRNLSLSVPFSDRTEPINLYYFLDLVDIPLGPKDITHLLHVYKEKKMQRSNTLLTKNLIRKHIPFFNTEQFHHLFEADPLFIFENTHPIHPGGPMMIQKFIDSTFYPFSNYISEIPINRIADQVVKLYITTETYDQSLVNYFSNNPNSIDGLVYISLFNPKKEYFKILLNGNSEYKESILKGLNSILNFIKTQENREMILNEYKKEILKIMQCEILYKTQLFIVYPLILENKYLLGQELVTELCDAVCRLFGTFYYVHQVVAVDLMQLIYEWYNDNKELSDGQSERIRSMIESIYTLYFCNCCHVKDKNILVHQQEIMVKLNNQFLVFNYDKLEKKSFLNVLKKELKKDFDEEYKLFVQKNLLEMIKINFVDDLVDEEILDLLNENILLEILESNIKAGENYNVSSLICKNIFDRWKEDRYTNVEAVVSEEQEKPVFDSRIITLAELLLEKISLEENKNGEWFRGPLLILMVSNRITGEQLGKVLSWVDKNFLLEHLNLVLETEGPLDVKFKILKNCDLKDIHLNFILKFYVLKGRFEPFFSLGFISEQKYIRDDFFFLLDKELPENKNDRYYALLGLEWDENVFYIFLRMLLKKEIFFNGIDCRNYILEMIFYDKELGMFLLRIVLRQIKIEEDITDVMIEFGKRVNRDVLSLFLEKCPMNEKLVVLAEKKKCYLNIVNSDIETTEVTVRIKTKALEKLVETDMYYSYAYSTAKFPKTKDALMLAQLDEIVKAQEKFEELQESAKVGDVSFDKNEFELWKNEWVKCAKKLQQWDLVQEVGNIMGDVDLSLESTLRLSNSFLECDKVKVKNLLEIKRNDNKIYNALITDDLDEIINKKLDSVYESFVFSRIREKELLDLQLLLEYKDFSLFSNADYETIRIQCIGLRDRYPSYHSSVENWNEIFYWRILTYQKLLKLSLLDSDGLRIKGYHELAKNYNEMAKAMLKNNLPDSALTILSRIFSLTNIEVTDAYDKIESDVECFIKKKEFHTGLEILNTANLNYFSPAQRSRIFNLKARLHEKLNRNEDAMKIYAQSVQLDYDVGDNWYHWALFLENIYYKLSYQDSAFQKETVEKNMFTAFLEASISCKGKKRNIATLKMINCFKSPSLYHIYESKLEQIDFTAYFFYIPQLFKILESENTISYLILSNIAKTHPQAIYPFLRSIFVTKYLEAIERGEYLEDDDTIVHSIVRGINYKNEGEAREHINSLQVDEGCIGSSEGIYERNNSLKTEESYSGREDFRNTNRIKKTAEEIFQPKYYSLLQTAKDNNINLILNLEKTLEIFIFKSNQSVEERILKLLRGVFDLAISKIFSTNKEEIRFNTYIDRAFQLFNFSTFSSELKNKFYKSFYGKKEMKIEDFILQSYLWVKIITEYINRTISNNSFDIPTLKLFNKEIKNSSINIFSAYSEISENYDNLVKIESIDPELLLRCRKGNYKRSISLRGDDGKKYYYTFKQRSKVLFEQERQCKQLYHYLSQCLTINLKKRRVRVQNAAQIEIDNKTIIEEQRERYMNLEQMVDPKEKEITFKSLEILQEITGRKNIVEDLRTIRDSQNLDELINILNSYNLEDSMVGAHNIYEAPSPKTIIRIMDEKIMDDNIKRMMFKKMLKIVESNKIEDYLSKVINNIEVYFAYKMNMMSVYGLDSIFFLLLNISTKKPSSINLLLRSCMFQYKNYVINSKKNDLPFRLTPNIQKYFKKEGIMGTFYSVAYHFLDMIENMNENDIKVFIDKFKRQYRKEDIKEMIKESMDYDELAKRDVLWEPWL